MKSRLLFLLVCAFFYSSAQEKWTYFNSDGMQLSTLFAEEDTLWMTHGNTIVKMNITTETMVSFDHTNSNLPNKNMNAIAKDAFGYLWIASDSALIQWDRKKNVTVYNSSNSSIPLASFNSITVAYGVIWLTSNLGVTTYNRQSWQTYTTSNSNLLDNNVKHIKTDSKGNVWVNQNYHGIAKYTGPNWTVYDPGGYKYGTVDDFAFDASDNVYVCKENELSVLKGSTWTNLWSNQTLPFPYYFEGTAMEVDKTGKLWIGSNYIGGALVAYQNNAYTYYNAQNSDMETHYLFDMTVDKYNNLWYASFDCLQKFDGTSWSRYNTSKSGLLSNSTSRFLFDASNTAWFTTQFGLSKFDGQSFTNWMKDGNGKFLNSLNDFALEDQGAVWMAKNKKLYKLKGNNWTTYTKADFSRLDTTLTSLAFDTKQQLWIGTGNGVLKYDGLNWTAYDKTNSTLFSNYVRQVKADSKGIVYALHDTSISMYNGTTWSSFTKGNSGLTVQSLSQIYLDRADNLYLSSSVWPKSSYCMYDKKTWSCTDFDSQVFYLAKGVDNILWVATGSDVGTGVSKYQGSNVKKYTSSNGLPSNEVNAISIDKQNKKWFATSLGIAVLDDNIATGLLEESTLLDKTTPSLSPNPFFYAHYQTLTFHTSEQILSMELYSMLGIPISNPIHCLDNQCELNQKDLKSGLYQVKANTASQQQMTFKLLVE